MAAGRLRALLVLGAALGFPPAGRAQQLKHTFENVKHIQISVHPTSSVHVLASDDNVTLYESHTTPGIEAKKEEKTLKNLVNILQNIAQHVPTEGPAPEEITPSFIDPNFNKTLDAVWLSVPQKHVGRQKTPAVTQKVTTTTPFWTLRTDPDVSIVLHTNKSSNNSSPTTPLKRVVISLQTVAAKTKSKTFDQLTNGSLENLVQSLKRVHELQEMQNITKPVEIWQNVRKKKRPRIHKKAKHGRIGDEIVEMIEKLTKEIQNAPDYVKQNPHLSQYVESAGDDVKKVLLLEKEAENSLEQLYHPEPSPSPSPSPSPQTVVVKQDTEKLRELINLLYDISPHITTYLGSSAEKLIPEDINEKAVAVLKAFKHVFCRSQAKQKIILKKLLEDDIKLLHLVLNNYE
ncbi:uncharacterized protein LOC106737922 [Alligator mississippiensis]|uniref:uncharacterized protein LOC106737922 n=1 Tax=Alligator mississippiensis TaxID=8496 RepID=UPI0028774506|nr:uncharacterized protein LOC106737922 [Alligator mississippiensis]